MPNYKEQFDYLVYLRSIYYLHSIQYFRAEPHLLEEIRDRLKRKDIKRANDFAYQLQDEASKQLFLTGGDPEEYPRAFPDRICQVSVSFRILERILAHQQDAFPPKRAFSAGPGQVALFPESAWGPSALQEGPNPPAMMLMGQQLDLYLYSEKPTAYPEVNYLDHPNLLRFVAFLDATNLDHRETFFHTFKQITAQEYQDKNIVDFRDILWLHEKMDQLGGHQQRDYIWAIDEKEWHENNYWVLNPWLEDLYQQTCTLINFFRSCARFGGHGLILIFTFYE